MQRLLEYRLTDCISEEADPSTGGPADKLQSLKTQTDRQGWENNAI